MKKLLILFLLCFGSSILAESISAQSDSLRDTTKAIIPAVPQADTTIRKPSVRSDSAQGPHIKMTPLLETKKPIKKRPPRFSVFDSLATYFTSPRLDQREMIDESWMHDAGDYFRFSPSCVVRDYQDSPMRKTVQPYGLTGNRLNTILNDMPVHPFEHIVEPDGMTDMNDLPTAWDKAVYVMPGASGMIFGGSNATASLFTRPTRPETIDPQSSLLVDKGELGYANTRGRFSKAFIDGRLMDMSIGYRTSGTFPSVAKDDSYHYDGSVYWPTSDNQALNLTGHLYERQGAFYLQPDRWNPAASAFNRHRFDRNAQMAYEIRSADKPSLWAFGYNYLREGSYLDSTQIGPPAYYGRFNLTGHGVLARHDWHSDSLFARMDFDADRLKYDDGYNDRHRDAADASLTLARPLRKMKLATRLGIRWSTSFGVMPQAVLLAERESERFYFMASVGLAEREPSLHERFLRYQQTLAYPDPNYQYADSGNPNLKVERQLTGSLLMEAGKIGNTLRLEFTGGKIFNGIDWNHETLPGTTQTVFFSPVNEDITFATVTAQQSLTVSSLFKLHGGGSYHYVDYAGDRSRPYQPDYNAFGGAELHYFWKQKLINFWAYGEAVYVSAYNGYFEQNLGNNVVLNTKLSFQMGNFRFYFLWQDPLNRNYAERDYFTRGGIIVSYGFTWNFFD